MGPIEQEFFARFKRRIDMGGSWICSGGATRCEDCRCNLPKDWKKKDDKAMTKETTLISAAEARVMSTGDWREALARIDDQIRKAAGEGKTSIRVPYDLVKVNGWNATFKNAEVQMELDKAKYVASTKSADAQFVDIWLEISW